jgi:thiosulfate/3-mercaptopyruvate sulfurtransferase
LKFTEQEVQQRAYAHPEVLVETNWVDEHLNDPMVRIAEVDYDPTPNYITGHIPGAVLFDWRKDMNDPMVRDILSKRQVEELLGRNGISNDRTLVLYGDFNNWFAAYAFWTLKYYGVENLLLMNGGRKKWILEDRKLDRIAPTYDMANFKAHDPDETIRVYRDYVRQAIQEGKPRLASLGEV